MFGRLKPEVSLLDSVYSKSKERNCNDQLLQKIDRFANWHKLEVICRPCIKTAAATVRASRSGFPKST